MSCPIGHWISHSRNIEEPSLCTSMDRQLPPASMRCPKWSPADGTGSWKNMKKWLPKLGEFNLWWMGLGSFFFSCVCLLFDDLSFGFEMVWRCLLHPATPPNQSPHLLLMAQRATTLKPLRGSKAWCRTKQNQTIPDVYIGHWLPHAISWYFFHHLSHCNGHKAWVSPSFKSIISIISIITSLVPWPVNPIDQIPLQSSRGGAHFFRRSWFL